MSILPIMIVTLLIGYIIGRSRRFYVYIGGKRAYRLEALEAYSAGRFMSSLFGMDYTEGNITPIYRPAVRFIRRKRELMMMFKISDFYEGAVWIVGQFPYLGIGFKGLHDEELRNAR